MGNKSCVRKTQKRLNLGKKKKLRILLGFNREEYSPEQTETFESKLEKVEKIIVEREKADPNYRSKTPSHSHTTLWSKPKYIILLELNK